MPSKKSSDLLSRGFSSKNSSRPDFSLSIFALLGVSLLGVAAILGIAPSPAQAPFAQIEQPKHVRILFAGDLMLDRSVARALEASSTAYVISSSTQALFKSADARVINLEGTVTTNLSLSQQNNTILRFTFDPAVAQDVLSFLHIDAVSDANNHAYDFGSDGLAQTRSYLAQWGVRSFGDPYNKDTLSTTLHINGMTLCLVGYHGVWGASDISAVAEVQRIRSDCDKVVVFAHWGVEYNSGSTDAQREAAHAFINAGADVVMGAHPHVVEPVEIYKNRAIFYSLGNFVFDQDFSWATEHGLAVMVDFSGSQTTFTLTPLTIAHERSSVASADDAARVLGSTGSVAQFTLP